MQLQIYLEPRTVCGCSFDVVNRGERSKGGGTAPRLWRRLSSPTLSSLVKKESGPRRAVAGLSGRYWFVEICKFVFKAWRSQVLRCACALGVSPMHKGAFGAQHCKGEQCSLSAKSLGHGFAATAPLSGEPLGLCAAPGAQWPFGAWYRRAQRGCGAGCGVSFRCCCRVCGTAG